MSNNIVEELPARKHAPIAVAPVKKEGQEPAKGGQSVPKGGDSEEASAKRIRQAVYDIRYRAKKDKITLQAAYDHKSVRFADYTIGSNWSDDTIS